MYKEQNYEKRMHFFYEPNDYWLYFTKIELFLVQSISIPPIIYSAWSALLEKAHLHTFQTKCFDFLPLRSRKQKLSYQPIDAGGPFL